MEKPIIEMDSIPSKASHIVADGTLHPIQIGQRLKEKCRQNIKAAIEGDPLKPVGSVYEEEFQKVKDALDEHDREELVSIMPTAKQMERCMYK